jgi:hypothetical protein
MSTKHSTVRPIGAWHRQNYRYSYLISQAEPHDTGYITQRAIEHDGVTSIITIKCVHYSTTTISATTDS